MVRIPLSPIGQQPDEVGPKQFPTLVAMRAARRWLVAAPNKEPFYTNGRIRNGTLDSPEDMAQFATYDDACKARDQRGDGWFLGFALGPDESGGHWQGIDIDDVRQNSLADIADAMPGYVEMSPSGEGAHAIGYGQSFGTLGSNQSGIEAYAAGRYFTVTEWPIRDAGPGCLAAFVSHTLVPRHGAARRNLRDRGVEVVPVDSKTVTELRSALNFLRADGRDQWIAVGHALRELGEVGRGLWLDWSRSSEKFDPAKDPKKWDGFKPSQTGYQSVFKKAHDAGWVNPASKSAQVTGVQPAQEWRQLVGRSLSGVRPRAIEWLWDGWIPKGYITLFVGETGAGKSTVIADIASRISTGAAWPTPIGVFGQTRRPERVLWLGSEDSIEEMTVPRLIACSADLSNVIEIEGVTENGERNTFSMQDDLAQVERWLEIAAVEGLPFAMLVIDPVTSYLPGQKLRKVDLNDAGHLRSILEPWLKLAQKHNIAIVCVTHFSNDTARSMLHRVLGTGAFAATCRSLCAVVEPQPTEEYEPEVHEKALVQVKTNLPEHPGGAWKFQTEKVEIGADERNCRPIFATRPLWNELDTAMSAKSLAGRASGPSSKYRTTFALWVKAQFASHPSGQWLPVTEIASAAIASNAASKSWWDKHSSDFLDKKNDGGTWMCKPKEYLPKAPPNG